MTPHALAGELEALNLSTTLTEEGAEPEQEGEAPGQGWSRLAPVAIGLSNSVIPGAGHAILGETGPALLGFGIGVGSQVLALGLSALYPTVKGSNLLGVKFQF